MALGRTDIGAAAALHAEVDVELLEGLGVFGMVGTVQPRRVEPERAGVQALAAADAGGLGHGVRFLGGEYQKAVIGLGKERLIVLAVGAHHGAAQDDLGRLALVAAAEIDDVLQLGADGDPYVLRLGYGAAIHRYQTAGTRHTGLGVLRQLDEGTDIHDQYADITGELALGDHTAGRLIDDDLFGALGVAGFELQHLQLAALFGSDGLQLFDGLGLVVFDADDRPAAMHMTQNQLRARQQQVGFSSMMR